MNFSDILRFYKPYKKLTSSMNKAPISVAGIEESAQGQLVYAMSADGGSNSLVICYSDKEAEQLCANMRLYTDRVVCFPSKEYVFYNIETKDHHKENKRLAVANRLLNESGLIVCASVDALLQYTISPEILRERTINFEPGKSFDLEKLCRELAVMGYARGEIAEHPGQFALRGGILDVFPPCAENPYRIEFFDEEVDSVRSFDRYSQRSLANEKNAVVIPAAEMLITNEARDRVRADIEESLVSCTDRELAETLERDSESFAQRRYFPCADKYAFEIAGKIHSLMEYFGENDRIFAADPKRITERGKTFEWEKGELIANLKEKGVLSRKKKDFFFGYNDFLGKISKSKSICMEPVTHTDNDIKCRSRIDFNTKTTISFHGKIDYLYADLKRWQDEKYTVVILVSTRGRAENLAGVLNDRGIRAKLMYDGGEFGSESITIMRGSLNKGYEYPDIRFVLISDSEIFDVEKKRRRRKKENADRIKSYNDISPGDYVVHSVHGIGEYQGTQKINVGGVQKDYLKIQYRGTDCLYVPVEQFDQLYKYIGKSEDKIVRLNKLGGGEWNRTKAKVKASTDELAKKLVKLYAQRSKAKGYAFAPDTPWQRDFEDTFPYQETEDQIRSIEEVKEDMEKDRPMDRLLCGDVGFGKTEVALRAAFKAVNDSKQVAYLCPTTVLAMQHYETFTKRMSGFPIKVEMLSRFRTAAQQREILRKLKTGGADIVIGTHRLLSKDVKFRDLGLLIVDEEQRFGVAHKERLKEIKNSVDVLTMTATPIPRTLHMAMTSVRDMSVLTQPPGNRYPVQTYVLEHNEAIITDAVRNELSRGGQVFYLYNRVDGIYAKAQWLRDKFPDAKVSVGHGKMREDELEEIMYDMVEGRTDILVCTTIIETGLDIPNANTMIIENADKMGLAQLYQLRGRVGRSNRAAYAYLTYRADKVLSEIASKRLRAIKEFTEFGSGFRIAMRDLEIRGAGNILGPQQHGHMDSVGYDMYCRILRESINEAKGIKIKPRKNTVIDIEVNAYIPESYVADADMRIEIYKKIAAVETPEDKSDIEDELTDRWGDIPTSVENIISVALLRARAFELGIEEISQHGTKMTVKFSDGCLDMNRISKLAKKYNGNMRLPSQTEPTVIIRIAEGNRDTIQIVNDLLNVLPPLDERSEKAYNLRDGVPKRIKSSKTR